MSSRLCHAMHCTTIMYYKSYFHPDFLKKDLGKFHRSYGNTFSLLIPLPSKYSKYTYCISPLANQAIIVKSVIISPKLAF